VLRRLLLLVHVMKKGAMSGSRRYVTNFKSKIYNDNSQSQGNL
jgi:hypothetical protein